jgi:trk system potassium uptake protein TrkA
MRITFVGASNVGVMTAKSLIDRGHEVVVIDKNREKIDALMEKLDCSFLLGDGGSPAILKEADPKATDVLFCLTNNDQVNIIASLVGRSLGFRRVIISIENPEYEHVCQELGLEDTVVPVRTISRFLADMLAGIDYLELRTVVKAEARLFSFTARDEDAGEVADLDLPSGAGVVWFYRDGQFHLADKKSRIHANDEVVIATESKNLQTLRERWQPDGATNSP